MEKFYWSSSLLPLVIFKNNKKFLQLLCILHLFLYRTSFPTYPWVLLLCSWIWFSKDGKELTCLFSIYSIIWYYFCGKVATLLGAIQLVVHFHSFSVAVFRLFFIRTFIILMWVARKVLNIINYVFNLITYNLYVYVINQIQFILFMQAWTLWKFSFLLTVINGK